jgi:hypothetical protein
MMNDERVPNVFFAFASLTLLSDPDCPVAHNRKTVGQFIATLLNSHRN